MRVIFQQRKGHVHFRSDSPTPGSNQPWLVEAPLHGVEILEAILRLKIGRTEPLKVWTSPAGLFLPRLFNRPGRRNPIGTFRFAIRDYIERDISYVLLSETESRALVSWLNSNGCGPWSVANLCTPFGMAQLFCVGGLGCKHSDEEAAQVYRKILEELGLPLDQPPVRSLLPTGAKPMPLCFNFHKPGSCYQEDCTEWPYSCATGVRSGEQNWMPWTEGQLEASCTSIPESYFATMSESYLAIIGKKQTKSTQQ